MGHIESTGKSNYGGAISNLGNMTIINSRFSGNSMTSDAPNYAHGSDVYNNGSSFSFGGDIGSREIPLVIDVTESNVPLRSLL